MLNRVRFGLRTHAGRRPNNEDAVWAAPTLGLFAVADGMGGYEGGEVASRLAVDSLHEHLARSRRRDDNALVDAVLAAHEEVRDARTGLLANMGCTLEAMLVTATHVIVAHVGDSRVYRLRGGVLQQLTRDHSLRAELLAAGCDLSVAFSHIITRALGMDGQIAPDVWSDEAVPGDVYLLCTDGLTEAVGPEAIHAILATATGPAAAADHLVERAYRGGSRDNISALVVAIQSSSPPCDGTMP